MNPIKHVAIIMDGNGRWGTNKGKSRNYAHKQGLKTVEKIIKESVKNKIKYLTLYAFSTENWKRPKNEINYLFSLLDNFLSNKIKELHQEIIYTFFKNIFQSPYLDDKPKLSDITEELSAYEVTCDITDKDIEMPELETAIIDSKVPLALVDVKVSPEILNDGLPSTII